MLKDRSKRKRLLGVRTGQFDRWGSDGTISNPAGQFHHFNALEEGHLVAEIEVKFLLPPDNREITVEMDDTLKPPDIVNELLAAQAINPNPHGYLLALKGGDFLNNDHELRTLNLRPGAVIRVIPATDAGTASLGEVENGYSFRTAAHSARERPCFHGEYPA